MIHSFFFTFQDSKPRTLSLKYALAMLALPKTLGQHPETGHPVEVRNGKFGPFIFHNNQMRSVPKVRTSKLMNLFF
jgi:DNA topoisomerase-1